MSPKQRGDQRQMSQAIQIIRGKVENIHKSIIISFIPMHVAQSNVIQWLSVSGLMWVYH